MTSTSSTRLRGRSARRRRRASQPTGAHTRRSVAQRAAEALLVARGRGVQQQAAGGDLGGAGVDRDQLARERLEIAKTAIDGTAAHEQTGAGLLRGIASPD